MEIKTERSTVTPEMAWEQREKDVARVAKCKADWEALDPEIQQATIAMVEDAVKRMASRVPEWLPEGWQGGAVEGGDLVQISLLFTDIDREIHRTSDS